MTPALTSGARLGSYEIVAPIGAGGMGEVYRARDPKLGRDVAIKVLPTFLALDAERLHRFRREARVLAALNHPHVAAIYGFEEADGVPALILELAEGPTLADRLAKGRIPIKEAVAIACQIAEAVAAAHAKRIIHRDLKPANVKVTPDGLVKVLDFGLAKALSREEPDSDLSQLPTVSIDQTANRILGTPAYMSPEQARGQRVDEQTDIWSFGCVLFEMLTGRMTFSGDTVSDTIVAILEREPAWDALPDAISPALRRLLRRCLEKDPKRRLHDIGDARLELDEALSAPETWDSPRPAGMTRRAALSALSGAAVGAAATGAFAISRYRNDATARRLTRFSIPLPEGSVAEASHNKRVAISRDGAQVAYTMSAIGQGQSPAANKCYVRSLNELEPKLLPFAGGTPFFSPDGHWLGFFGAGAPGSTRLGKVALSGGAPVTLCSTEAFGGGTWTDDDNIYLVPANPGSLFRIPAAGGQPQEVAKVDFAKGGRLHKYPCAIFGTKAILFTLATADVETFDDARIAVFDAKTGQQKTLVEGGTHPRYSPSGHLIYARGGTLLAVRFDSEKLAISGQPFTVLEGVQMSVNSGVANFDISGNGDLIYIPGAADKGERTLVWVDRNGKAERLPLPARSYLHPRISPDGRQLAVEVEGPNHDFYVYDFARAVLSKLTTDGESHWPVWSPDGGRLAYRSGRMTRWTMWQMPADRSGSPQQLLGTGMSQSAESWAPDGHAIVYTAVTSEPGTHIMVASLEGDGRSRAFADIKAPAGSPKFSPDGRWLTYCSNESGKAEVYVQAYPGPGPKIQVSNDGGTDPVWRRNAEELYYRNGDSMMVVAVSTAPAFKAGRPQELWKGHYSHGFSASCGPPGATSSNYDATPDGSRFLMIEDEAPDKALSKHVVVALNWADEVRRLSAKA